MDRLGTEDETREKREGWRGVERAGEAGAWKMEKRNEEAGGGG